MSWLDSIIGFVSPYHGIKRAAFKQELDYIKKHDFKAFGWYRIVLGILVLGYFAVAVHR